MHINNLDQTLLGKTTHYDLNYDPELLFPIPRIKAREEMAIDSNALPFYGYDLWNHYEVSWLNPNGKPQVALVEILYDCSSPNIIESKSMKLYFNSLNNTKVESLEKLEGLMVRDLSAKVGSPVKLIMSSQSQLPRFEQSFHGESLDSLEVACQVYEVDASLLKVGKQVVTESLHSDLLRTNCPVTNQPDWGSVQIRYVGPQIEREGLLKYIVSFRNHNGFHEQCIERMFIDLMARCQPTALTVYGRYTRRGGLDINPYRSTQKVQDEVENVRLIRQ
jgi:7-cyano-7-deazaguanine reductase